MRNEKQHDNDSSSGHVCILGDNKDIYIYIYIYMHAHVCVFWEIIKTFNFFTSFFFIIKPRRL